MKDQQNKNAPKGMKNTTHQIPVSSVSLPRPEQDFKFAETVFNPNPKTRIDTINNTKNPYKLGVIESNHRIVEIESGQVIPRRFTGIYEPKDLKPSEPESELNISQPENEHELGPRSNWVVVPGIIGIAVVVILYLLY